jgi:hypothetical protein
VPDTSAARQAITAARAFHVDIMGGLSMAELKLKAAGGVLCDEDPLPYADDDPVWLEHALTGLDVAQEALAALGEALDAAIGEVAKFRRGARA